MSQLQGFFDNGIYRTRTELRNGGHEWPHMHPPSTPDIYIGGPDTIKSILSRLDVE